MILILSDKYLDTYRFAKKSKQKKATTLPLPFGFPIVQDKKWESLETRFAQTTRLSLSIFCLAQLAVSEVDENQNQDQKQKQRSIKASRRTADSRY